MACLIRRSNDVMTVIYLCGFDGGKTEHWDSNYPFSYSANGHNGYKEMKHIKELEEKNKIEFID